MDNRLTWVYLLEREDGRFYVGLSADVAKRVHQHQHHQGARFARRQAVRLVGALPVGTRSQAYALERRLKGWTPEAKQSLFHAFPYPPSETPDVREDLLSAMARIDELTSTLAVQRYAVATRIHDAVPQVDAFLRYTRTSVTDGTALLETLLFGPPLASLEARDAVQLDALLATLVRGHFRLGSKSLEELAHG